MTNEEHNGWTNRETWQVQLHLANTRADYDACRAIAENCGTDLRAGALIRDYVEWSLGLADEEPRFAPQARDLITGALARVNWAEIGQSFREDAR